MIANRPMLLLGDNQFLGVNHMSEHKAAELEKRFPDADSILDVIRAARDIGYDGFMCTVHDKLLPVFNQMSVDSSLHDFPVFPCIPYAHKYNDAITEHGTAGAIVRQAKHFASLANLRSVLSFATSRELNQLMKVLVRGELSQMATTKIQGVYLQNAVTDLLLGIGATRLLRDYVDFVRRELGVSPGLITLNPAMLVRALDDQDIESVDICTPVNRSGFRMNPCQEDSLRYLSQCRHRVVAMSVFASGSVEAQSALTYVKAQQFLSGVVVGASTESHLRSTHEIFRSER